MTIRFYEAEDIRRKVSDIVATLGLEHVDMERVFCVRSTGSQARRTLARCYALPRIWQAAMGKKAHYLIEVISEAYDRLPADEKERTLVHEILHIPRAFGGGFRHHGDHVTERNVERLYQRYRSLAAARRDDSQLGSGSPVEETAPPEPPAEEPPKRRMFIRLFR